MRWVVYGAGAVGGVLGARLYDAGHDVVLVARGPHLEVILDVGRFPNGCDESTRRVAEAFAARGSSPSRGWTSSAGSTASC